MPSLVRGQDKGNALSTSKMCTFCSLRLLMCMAETSGSRMTQALRHNIEAAPVCTKLLLMFSRAYKRASRPLGILISNFLLFAFGRSGGAEERGPAGVQVGTGEDQVGTANLFTL
jgi:hypothetical protein